MRKTHITGIILTVIILLLLYGFLGLQPLYLEEQRRAVVAQEMLFSGDYVVPTIYGELYYKKPPVWNWMLLGSFHIFGNQSEFSLRFFAVLSFILTAILVFILTRKHFGERAAWPAALLYLVSADLFLYFSLTAEIDLFYSLLIFGIIALIHPLYQRKRWLLLYSAVYFIGGIAFLTKGMPTLVFIALSLG
ncbi:MAG: glycosyltransferase family 39 protein, partial [Bacteroidales bacterium]|nr:glycosyltransferase family 39 protein [Bacteroidales bacterium]